MAGTGGGVPTDSPCPWLTNTSCGHASETQDQATGHEQWQRDKTSWLWHNQAILTKGNHKNRMDCAYQIAQPSARKRTLIATYSSYTFALVWKMGCSRKCTVARKDWGTALIVMFKKNLFSMRGKKKKMLENQRRKGMTSASKVRKADTNSQKARWLAEKNMGCRISQTSHWHWGYWWLQKLVYVTWALWASVSSSIKWGENFFSR